jgi:hypothetical protein
MAQKHVYSHTASKVPAKSAASVKMSRRSKRAALSSAAASPRASLTAASAKSKPTAW